MPEEGMYHTNDPEIEATTHQIRKKFHETIQEIKYQGHLIENVEAFLVSPNDMNKLHKLFSGSDNGYGGSLDGQMRMYGVKIIESQYVLEGTIFKVFKNKEDMLHPVSPIPMPISGSISYPVSSLIPNLGFSKDQIDDAMTTTSIDEKDVTTYPKPTGEDIKENMTKAMKAINKVLDEPLPSNKKAEEKRHSDKRRIELD